MALGLAPILRASSRPAWLHASKLAVPGNTGFWQVQFAGKRMGKLSRSPNVVCEKAGGGGMKRCPMSSAHLATRRTCWMCGSSKWMTKLPSNQVKTSLDESKAHSISLYNNKPLLGSSMSWMPSTSALCRQAFLKRCAAIMSHNVT
jgi:hypothetical protein